MEGLGLDQIGEWVRTGGTLGLLALAAKLFLDNRRLSLTKAKDDRDGYGVLITALQDDIARVREQHRQCEERLNKVEAELVGVHRQLVMQGSVRAVSMGGPSDHVRAASKRAVNAVQKPRDIEKDGDK